MSFEESCESAKRFEWSNEEKQQLYGLFKQATVGDVTDDRPTGMLSWVAQAKWDAWNAKRGLPTEQAKAEYVQLVNQKRVKVGEE